MLASAREAGGGSVKAASHISIARIGKFIGPGDKFPIMGKMVSSFHSDGGNSVIHGQKAWRLSEHGYFR